MKKHLLKLSLAILVLLGIGTSVSGQTLRVLIPSQGGTGTGTPPTYGQLLVGNSSGTYTLTSTSSLLSGYVPYVGATTDVLLGNNNLTAGTLTPAARATFVGEEVTVDSPSGTPVGAINTSGGNYYPNSFAYDQYPGNFNYSETYDPSGSYSPLNTYHEWYVFGYKTINGTKTYSSQDNGYYAYNSFQDDGVTGNYYVSLSWDANGDNEGYLILKYENFSFMGGYETTGTSLVDGDGSMSWDSITYGSPPSPQYYYTAQNHTARIYTYKNAPLSGTRVYSADYIESASTPGDISGNPYSIDWTWDAISGIDGYRVFVYADVAGYNYDYYYDVAVNNVTDDGSSMTNGTTFTPSSPYTDSGLNVTGNAVFNSDVLVSGQLVAGDGTAASPSLTFNGSLTTGLFQPEDDVIGFSTIGQERMRVSLAGNVLINLTSDSGSARLDVNGATQFGNNGLAAMKFGRSGGSTYGGQIQFLYGGPNNTGGGSFGGDFTGVFNGAQMMSFGFNNQANFEGTFGTSGGRQIYFTDRVRGEFDTGIVAASGRMYWKHGFSIAASGLSTANDRFGAGIKDPLVRGDFRATNPKATTATYEDILQIGSRETSSVFTMRMGLKTDSTAGNRYAGIEVDDAGTKRPLAIQANGGNVGIGTTTPSSLLTISGSGGFGGGGNSSLAVFKTTSTGNNSATISLQSNSNTFDVGKYTSGASPANAAFFNQRDSAPILFQFSGTSRAALTTTGLGIGTTTPQYPLHVVTAGSNPDLVVEDTSSWASFNLKGGQAGDVMYEFLSGYPNAGDFSIREFGVADRFTIKKTTGNVGIGTSSPSSLFTVASSTTATTTVEFGDRYSTNSKACFNTKNIAGGNISFYFVGTTMVVENNRCN